MVETSFRNTLIFRIAELIGCTACLGLSVYIFNDSKTYLAIATYTACVISTLFAILTLWDLVALLCTPNRIPWAIHYVFVVAAACLFFFAAGLLFSAIDLMWHYRTSAIFGLTGFVFLLEILCLARRYGQKTTVCKIVPVLYDTTVVQKREEPSEYLEPVEEPEIVPLQVPEPVTRSYTASYFEKLDQTGRGDFQEKKPSITNTFQVSNKTVAPMPSSSSMCRPFTANKCSSEPITTKNSVTDRRLYTAPVNTNDCRSCPYENVEKVQVAKPTTGSDDEAKNYYQGLSRNNQMEVYIPAAGTSGIMTYRCSRCGRWRRNLGMFVYICIRCNKW